MSNEKKNAFVTLIMIGDNYIPGALVLAYSIKKTNTKHDVVCMVTDDVSENGKITLKEVFDHVILVPKISIECKRLKSEKQNAMYGKWINHSFTKWNCLDFTQYNKVLFLDADMIVFSNIDNIFKLKAPAATFSSPWCKPFVDTGAVNPYGQPKSGDQIKTEDIVTGLKKSIVCVGAVVLMNTSKEDLKQLNNFLIKNTPYGHENCMNGMDEQSIAEFYACEKKVKWTNIHQRYQSIPWHLNWNENNIPKCYHYFNAKPWNTKRSEWKDMEPWFELATALLSDKLYDNELLKKTFISDQIYINPVQECQYCINTGKKQINHCTFDIDGTIKCPILADKKMNF